MNLSKWKVKYLKEFEKDLKKIDKSLYEVVFKGIDKVSENPLPNSEGGYGKPYRDWETDRKSTRLNSSHITRSRMPSSA